GHSQRQPLRRDERGDRGGARALPQPRLARALRQHQLLRARDRRHPREVEGTHQVEDLVTGPRRVRYRVEPGAEARLDVFLAAQDLGLSRSQLRRLIDGALVAVNGAPAKQSLRLRSGDEVWVEVPPPEPAEAIPEDIALDVRYEDPHLVVVMKPAGMVVHPAAGV